MKVALYARISTANHGQDVELQLRELREHCKARGWKIADEYVDKISGMKMSRPNLDKLMADARRSKFDMVLVWKFDRFARSTKHLIAALHEFKSLGVAFASLTEGIDTSTPMGEMVFTVLGAVAQLERSLIVERVNAGLRNARTKGVILGRPRSKVEAAVILARLDAGESQRSIAKSLGVSPALVNKRLKAAEKI